MFMSHAHRMLCYTEQTVPSHRTNGPFVQIPRTFGSITRETQVIGEGETWGPSGGRSWKIPLLGEKKVKHYELLEDWGPYGESKRDP